MRGEETFIALDEVCRELLRTDFGQGGSVRRAVVLVGRRHTARHLLVAWIGIGSIDGHGRESVRFACSFAVACRMGRD